MEENDDPGSNKSTAPLTGAPQKYSITVGMKRNDDQETNKSVVLHYAHSAPLYHSKYGEKGLTKVCYIVLHKSCDEEER